MAYRAHKVLLDSTRDHFGQIVDNGKKLNVNTAANAVNPYWAPYTEVCIEAWELFPHVAMDGQAHNFWVLRGELRCCCASACPYAGDHVNHDSYAKVASVSPSPSVQVTNLPHGPASGYIEARIDMTDLMALAAQAKVIVNGGADGRTKLAKVLSDDAARFELSIDEIEGMLGVIGVDDNGLRDSSESVAAVLAGTETSANAWYCVMAMIKLWQRLVHAVHQRLALDWPQRGRACPIRFSPRP
ncbi:MAG: hypothetical protein KGL39_13660 [Patescibacteria group bacterium]|nr:hypothetical protein [Patescibacteria group bacterium]